MVAIENERERGASAQAKRVLDFLHEELCAAKERHDVEAGQMILASLSKLTGLSTELILLGAAIKEAFSGEGLPKE